MAKTKNQIDKSNIVWKGAALVFVAIFCAIIIVGVIRLYRFQSTYQPASQAEITLAENAVAQDLNSSGDSISNYQVAVSNDTRTIADDGLNETIIQVSLFSPSKRQSYLLDASSGQIVMHTITTFYGVMQNISNAPHRGGFFPWLKR